MPRLLRLALVLAAVPVVLPACGFMTAEEAAREFLPVFCDKMKECNPTGFASAFPGGQQECIDKGIATIPEDKRQMRDACTESEIDVCVEDTRKMACPATTMAPSCAKC